MEWDEFKKLENRINKDLHISEPKFVTCMVNKPRYTKRKTKYRLCLGIHATSVVFYDDNRMFNHAILPTKNNHV
jgi:hypothetical protein